MSDDLQAQFEKAAQDVTALSQAPDNDVMLKLYALFKQGKQGDCEGKRPGMMDFVKRAKFDAWKTLEGTSQENAMQKYIDVVNGLVEADK